MFEELKNYDYFNEVVKFFENKGIIKQSYLVGGTVRDLILNRSLIDLDFAVKGDTLALAKEFAAKVGGTFVVLDEVFSVARVVKDRFTIDFSELRGESIENDLSERDFTINAIALELSELKVIDPFFGFDDLKKGVIRMVREENLKADPLRILRAYRFCGTLNFRIDESTREGMVKNSHLLKATARERIKDELWKILCLPNSSETLKLMIEDNVFSSIFRNSDFSPLRINLQGLVLAEKILSEPKNLFDHPKFNIAENLKGTLKFTILFGFTSPSLIRQLKPSKKEERFVEALLRGATAIKKIENLIDKVRFLREFEQILYPLLVYAVSNDPLGTARGWFYRDIENFYRKVFLKNRAKLPLITGDDLIEAGFEPSPLIGQILERVEILTLTGKLSKKEEALEEAKRVLQLMS